MKKNIAIALLSLFALFAVLNYFGGWFVRDHGEKLQTERENFEKNGPLSSRLPQKDIIDPATGQTTSTKEIASTFEAKHSLKESVLQDAATMAQKAKVKDSKLTEFTKFTAVANGTIPVAKVEIAPNKFVTVRYQGKHLTFVTKVDSTGLPVGEPTYAYKGDIKRAVVEKPKTIFFNQKAEETEIISFDDPAFKPENIENWKVKRVPLQYAWRLTLQNNVNLTVDDPLYNNATSVLQLNYNPDGFISPGIGAGYYIPLNTTSKPSRIIAVKATINIAKVPKKQK